MFIYDHQQGRTQWGARIILFLVTSTGIHTQALASEYVLEKGDAEAVCVEFGKNLRLMGTECLIPISQDLPDLLAPDWITDDDRLMPASPNLNLYTEIGRYLWERDANPV